MRYFLDTEFNSFGGELISLALVPEFGDQEYYAVLQLSEEPHPWVVKNVMPYLASVPPSMICEELPRDVVAREVAHYLAGDPEPLIVADWPEDIALFCSLLLIGPGMIVPMRSLGFYFFSNPGFSTAENSKVPHNALHDARALRNFVLSNES